MLGKPGRSVLPVEAKKRQTCVHTPLKTPDPES